ncbi:hypothetical protein GJ744_009334 [Endocarpon pusillum]|uniref:Fumarylacetoacetase-like C-terminal domain-containing protein n=1 Tax=Endocarpon pusillum TaxID=364733 RepID=A0A8H7AG50_9EURO|nr:hypothetical protein GJ744_009334 [Endocarpon pusillum]
MASIRANCRKIVCIGRNYASHIAELSSPRPSQPIFFLKPASSLLPPSSGPIIRPRGVLLHHEIELGLVMCKPLRNLPLEPDPDLIRSAIGAYVLAIDLTARNIQTVAKRDGLPWTVAKGFDGFCPVSAPIPKDRIPDPAARGVTLWLSVNGRERQRGSTSEMIFGVECLLGHVSRVMTLEVGDLVLTGTPEGVGS